MARKYEAINLLQLALKGSSNGWNEVLLRYYRQQNINALAKLRYQLQAGMDDLAKQKMVTPELTDLYIRWLRSLEKTARAIIRDLHPMPGDKANNVLAREKKWHEAKRKRDTELRKFLADSSY